MILSEDICFATRHGRAANRRRTVVRRGLADEGHNAVAGQRDH